LRSAPKPHFNPLRLMEGEGEIQGEGAQNDVYEKIGDVDEVVDDDEAEQGAPIDEDNKAVAKTTKATDNAPEKDSTAGFDLKNTHPLDASKPDGHGVFNRITGRVDDSFVQSLIQVGDVDGNTNEHGDTDGEAPADYVAPVEAAEEDDSEDAEEKVDDDSEEGVADEESEEVSGPTGGAFLQKDVDDSESDDNVEDSTDGGAVPEDEENVDAANDDKEAGTGEEDGAESFLQVASKGSDDYSDADDEEDESNDSTELSSVLKDGTDDIEQGFDLDEDDAAVIADDESEEDVEALESEEEDSDDEDQ